MQILVEFHGRISRSNLAPPPKFVRYFFSMGKHQQHFYCYARVCAVKIAQTLRCLRRNYRFGGYMNMVDKNSVPPNETQPSLKTPPPLQPGRGKNSHDAFFKEAVANITHAKALMRHILPAVAQCFPGARRIPKKAKRLDICRTHLRPNDGGQTKG